MADCNFTEKELETEIWKVCAQDTRYAVSDLGRVKRITPAPGTTVGKILKPYTHLKTGYDYIAFSRHGSFSVHRLVCTAFHGEPPTAKHEPNHIDTCRTNNRADNLEWLTRKENLAYAVKLGHHNQGERNGGVKITVDTVHAILKGLADGRTGRSLAHEFHLSTAQISRIRTGKRWANYKVSPNPS